MNSVSRNTYPVSIAIVSVGLTAICALFATVLVSVPDQTGPILVLVIAPLLVATSWRLSLGKVTLVAMFLSAASYRGLLYATQMSVAGIVINPLDLVWLLIGLKLLAGTQKNIALPTAAVWTTLIAILTVASGLLWGQPVYNIVKLFRAEIFLALGIALGANLAPKTFVLALKGLVLGGVVTGLSQIATFAFASFGINIWRFLGISASASDDYYITGDLASSSYRDNGVVINFAVFAILILLASSFTGRPLFHGSVTYALATICLFAVILSLTRSNWLALTLAMTIALTLAPRHLFSRIWGHSFKFGIGFALVILVALALGGRNVLEIVTERLFAFGNQTDGDTLTDRLIETQAVWRLTQGGGWILGIGAADITYVAESPSGLSELIVRNQLHNGFAQVYLGAGIVGLFAFLAVITQAIHRLFKKFRHWGAPVVAFTFTSAFLVLVAACLISLTGGLINDAQQSTVVGLMIGFSTVGIGALQTSYDLQEDDLESRRT